MFKKTVHLVCFLYPPSIESVYLESMKLIVYFKDSSSNCKFSLLNSCNKKENLSNILLLHRNLK